MINVAVIGAGRIGKVHTENITKRVKHAKVTAIAEPLLNDEIKVWAKSLGISKCYKDYKEILYDKSIQAVLVCSSTDTHSSISIDMIEAGKHVFCEKPVDHDIEKINKVIKALRNSNVLYQVGFNRRFDHNFRAAKQAIVDNKIGKINIIKITSRDPAPPPLDYIKVSGGLFLDMMIHDFDMVRFISNSEIQEIFALGDNLISDEIGKVGDIDTAIVTMKLENNALAVIDNSRKTSYGYDQRLEVFGSLGQISIGNDASANMTLSTKDGIIGNKPLHFFLERYKDAYALEIEMFIDSIINNKDVAVDIYDGLKNVIIGLAAKESLLTRKPVKIDEFIKKLKL